MSLATQSPTFGDFPPLHLPVRRFSVEEYHELLRTGFLQCGDPVELLEGILVIKMAKHPPHVLSCELVRDALSPLIPSGWFIQAQEPVTTADSEACEALQHSALGVIPPVYPRRISREPLRSGEGALLERSARPERDLLQLCRPISSK